MKQKIFKSLKVFSFFLLILFVGAFIYIVISIRFPVFDIDKNPSVKIHYKIDKNDELVDHISITSFRLKNKFGGHMGLNPIYHLAQSIFYQPREFKLCFAEGGELAFKRQTSSHWFTHFGWAYYLDREGIKAFLENLPKNKVINEGIVVEGNCTLHFDDNHAIAKYALHYVLPHLKSFYSSKSLMNVTYNQALKVAKTRIKLDAGYTQLDTAIRQNCLDCVKELIAKGVNVNGPVSTVKNESYSNQKSQKKIITPLRIAMRKKNVEIFTYLLGQGARDKLSYSAKKDRVKYFTLQLNHGADINEKDYYGHTPLGAAINYRCFECVKQLVNRGVDVNTLSDNQTPLNAALLTNNYEITKYLLDHGAKKELLGRGFTAYDIINRGDMVKNNRIIELFKN